jgi:hypothetical protein
LKNFSKYAAESKAWYLYDNSGSEYIIVAKSLDGEKKIFNFDLYNNISGI